ncbi:TetR/AcrR family transcriptional regulator [Pseudonocardia xinjiangensis]|uniref:TetR family transcriptional regulator n=1 Tax=Pseudonocardia xinjiangensis TaxID=75289 RepID=A0ABX1R7V5_9PSEU|nr:TetR/AcrR family transcriptional regulator [Pseudonocardia xinjiangensis]NMH75544.1 TetR family transcriptional regulator [Pseudonocardia xinjiangensis]
MEATVTRERIVDAAAALLAEGGREAVSTRAVSAAAGVQAPTIYRIFGDKQGLLDAVASRGVADYLRGKTARERDPDPVQDLRRGFDLHVGFGLAHPALYALIYGEPRPGVESAAKREATAVLAGMIRRIAEAGRLRVSEERAVRLVHSAGCGITFTLIGLPPEQRDPALSELARESVLATVTTDRSVHAGSDAGPVATAVTLRAALPQLSALSRAERRLLGEWLDRLAADL